MTRGSRPELKDADPLNRPARFPEPAAVGSEFVRDNALSSPACLIRRRRPSSHPYHHRVTYAAIQFPACYYPEKYERQIGGGIDSCGQRTFMHPMLAKLSTPRRGRLHGRSGGVEHAAAGADAV